MSSKHNRERSKWQDYGSRRATKAEHVFYSGFEKLFQEKGKYAIDSKPKEFRHIYEGIALSKKERSEIYTPDAPITRHGILIDCAIENKKTGKRLYVEVKRQDGWVEGKSRSAGRGNAHERSCKFFTPGLLRVLRGKSGISEPALPFWTVFQGDITRDPCRVREITCWYEGCEAHFFFWRNSPDTDLLFDHFNKKLKHLLD